MNIVPPLTREQCQLIVEHYENRVVDALRARERYIQATQADPVLSPRSYLVGMESCALHAEEQAAIAQLHALQAIERLAGHLREQARESP